MRLQARGILNLKKYELWAFIPVFSVLVSVTLIYFVSLAVGEPPFGLTELIFDRVKDGGKLHVTPKADAGTRWVQWQ